MTLTDIASAIKRNNKRHKPVLIAIEGFGGSGKSTIAEKLKDSLQDAYIISIDDFIIRDKLTDKSSDEPGFDRGRLAQQVLIPATSGQSVAYQRLEWAKNSLSAPIKVPNVAYLIVEGISSYHPSIAKYYDYMVWVNTPIEVAKQRGKQRDAGNENEQHWDLWAENDLAYQQKYHPEQQADFVIDNESSNYA